LGFNAETVWGEPIEDRGGTTSVDVTRQGIDKGYGIRKLRDILGVATSEMIFVGDALFPGGNDYPAKEAGVVSIQVRDPNETKRVIEAIIACLDSTRTNESKG
jgi:hydroxymethylpyrimidine pyrophosphatase-like HAD family hydrolase